MLTAFLFLAFAQSGRQRPATPSAPTVSDWKIEMTTDGGFAGIGVGGLTVSSDGSLTITLMSSKKCTYQLTAAELQSLNAAVNNARPGSWLECYSLADTRTHCCDLVRTTMTLSEHGNRDVFTTSWLTGAPPFPMDLENLVDLLRGPAGIDARYRPLCASAP
jgi:hypothetical protein